MNVPLGVANDRSTINAESRPWTHWDLYGETVLIKQIDPTIKNDVRFIGGAPKEW
jgi:hypothetical protein